MSGEILLEGHDLTRSFGEGEARTTAVDGASVALRAGEMTVLMGPSGSGKSTLLALLAGLLQPTSGRVVALGRDLWELTEEGREAFRREHCGFIFQGYNLFPSLTAQEQMEMALRWTQNVSRAEARRRVGAMLEQLGLGRRATLRPEQLSGGEKQRVAIGRALIKGPTFCFADEPTSALDWAHGEEVVQLLRAAGRDRGAAILLITHDPRVLPYADRVVHMHDGQIEGAARPTPTPEAVR